MSLCHHIHEKILRPVGYWTLNMSHVTHTKVLERLVKWKLHGKIFCLLLLYMETRGGTVGWVTALQAGRSRVRFPMVWLEFFWHIPSGRTVAPESTRHPTRMSTRNISWGSKGGRCVGLTTLPVISLILLESWDSVQACTRDCFTFTFTIFTWWWSSKGKGNQTWIASLVNELLSKRVEWS